LRRAQDRRRRGIPGAHGRSRVRHSALAARADRGAFGEELQYCISAHRGPHRRGNQRASCATSSPTACSTSPSPTANEPLHRRRGASISAASGCCWSARPARSCRCGKRNPDQGAGRPAADPDHAPEQPEAHGRDRPRRPRLAAQCAGSKPTRCRLMTDLVTADLGYTVLAGLRRATRWRKTRSGHRESHCGSVHHLDGGATEGAHARCRGRTLLRDALRTRPQAGARRRLGSRDLIFNRHSVAGFLLVISRHSPGEETPMTETMTSTNSMNRSTVLAGLRRWRSSAAPATMASAQQPATPAEKGPKVWLDMDQQQLDDAYDQAKYAPNFVQVMKRYASNSAAMRVRIGEPKRASVTAPPRSRSWKSTRPKQSERADPHSHSRWRVAPAPGNGLCLSRRDAGACRRALCGADFVSVDETKGDLIPMVDQVQAARSPGPCATRSQLAAIPRGSTSPAFSSGSHLAGVALLTDWKKDFDLPDDAIKGAVLSSGHLRPQAGAPFGALQIRQHHRCDVEEALSTQRHLARIRTCRSCSPMAPTKRPSSNARRATSPPH
jgi:arylformamidase